MIMRLFTDRFGSVLLIYVLNPMINDLHFGCSETRHIRFCVGRYPSQFSFFENFNLALPFKLNSNGHKLPRDRTMFLPNVRGPNDRLAVQNKRASLRKPQNLVEFCGAKPISSPCFPSDVDNERFELLTIKLHFAATATTNRLSLSLRRRVRLRVG